MKNYIINWLELCQSTSGKEYLKVSLLEKAENGAEREIQNVSIWRYDKDNREFPNFTTLAAGHSVSGNLWQKPGTQFFSLYAPKEEATNRPPEAQNGVLRPSEAQKQGLSGSDKKTRLMRIITEIQNLSEEANSLLR